MIKAVKFCRELRIQVECGGDGDVTMNGVANRDELKTVEGLGDNYRDSPHCCNEESDAGTPPVDDGAPLRTVAVVDQMDCQIR